MMKKLSLILIFWVMLSFSVLATDDSWSQKENYYVKLSANALTDGNSYFEKDLVNPESIKVYDAGDKAFVCVNCPKPTDEANYGIKTFDCSNRVCVFYTGLKKFEGVTEGEDFVQSLNLPENGVILQISNVESYKPNEFLLRNGIENVKINDVKEDDIIIINESIKKYYQWPTDDRHVFRVENAKVAIATGDYDRFLRSLTKGMSELDLDQDIAKIDFKGKVLAVRTDTPKQLGFVWADGLGLPVIYGHNIIPFYDKVDGQNVLKFELNAEDSNEKESADDWLDNLPDNFKDKEKERSELELCGQKFTNYYKGSYFVVVPKNEPNKQGCFISSYYLNTLLFEESDKENWKEFEYNCGANLKLYAIGGDFHQVHCLQKNKDSPMLYSQKKGGANDLQFRIKVDDYWLSFPKGTYFAHIINEFDSTTASGTDSYTIMTSDMRVSQHIPNTGGPARYKGDMLSFDTPKKIKFVMPNNKDYVKTDILEPQLQFKSDDSSTILRRVYGINYIYKFQKPHTDYVLQLGFNVDRAMNPIISLFPKEGKLSQEDNNQLASVESSFARHEIPVIGGASVDNVINLKENNKQEFIVSYNPKQPSESKRVKVKTETGTCTVKKGQSLEDALALCCYDKNFDQLKNFDKPLTKNVKEGKMYRNLLRNEYIPIIIQNIEIFNPEINKFQTKNNFHYPIFEKGYESSKLIIPNLIKYSYTDKKKQVHTLNIFSNSNSCPINLEKIPSKAKKSKSQQVAILKKIGIQPQSAVFGMLLPGLGFSDGSYKLTSKLSSMAKRLVSNVCNINCKDIAISDMSAQDINPDIIKQKCNLYGKGMKMFGCDTACTYIEGSGCMPKHKCGSGSAEGCKYTLDKVNGKTCDLEGMGAINCILR